MSPREPTALENLGGLSEAQIDLRIKTNNEYTAALWAKAMDEHAEKIDARFDLHEQKDALRIEKQERMVASRLDSQDLKLDAILELVTINRASGEEWHIEDLKYRAGVQDWRDTQEPKIQQLVNDVATVQLRQDDINTKFNLIQWFVLLCKGFVKSSDATIAIAEKGSKLTGSLAAIFSFILLCWQAFRHGGMIDFVKEIVAKHH